MSEVLDDAQSLHWWYCSQKGKPGARCDVVTQVIASSPIPRSCCATHAPAIADIAWLFPLHCINNIGWWFFRHLVDLHCSLMQAFVHCWCLATSHQFPHRLHFTLVSLGLGEHKSSVQALSPTHWWQPPDHQLLTIPNHQLAPPPIAKIPRAV